MAKDFTYTMNIDANVSGLTSKLNTLKEQLSAVLGSKADTKMTQLFADIERRLDSIQTKAKTPVHNVAAFNAIEKELSQVSTLIGNVDKEINKLGNKKATAKIGFLPQDEQVRLQKVLGLIKQIQDLNNKQQKDAEKLAQAKSNLVQYEQAQKEAIKQRVALQAQLDAAKEDGTSDEKIFELQAAYKEATAAVTSYSNKVSTAKSQINELTEAQTQNKATLATLKTEAKAAGVSLEHVGSNVTDSNLQKLEERLVDVVNQGLRPFNDTLKEAQATDQQFNEQVEKTNDTLNEQKQDFIEQDKAAGEVDGLVNRIKQFTGLTGAALILRRALRSAFETTKELDKQMTEMAVVTNLGVGDYWEQLPEHTEQANKLGVAIKDVYEAETLYYQQGLKTAQVQKLSTATLKMARIASLSAEDATNKMTAALRGFNMEINETNADRIADVYSKLAAITASNVQEISTAMTKTASLASNAGMEFETTAAFLSQIIETTRESAETAGTALKTVIARFQELKKSPDEIGEIEGEIVDANKIETALRSVGVALRDTRGQFRDLDDVFIELSSKWDSLDTNTQRYIATIAAGSRQQSRFIAMMSNYARTQELVSAANNAAGASNEQFEKTLESLESKLAQLKNAWNTLTQGIANNKLIKGAVSMLTGILTAINKITKGFGPWSGSILKVTALVAALKAGDVAISAFTNSMKESKSILTSLGKGFAAPIKGIKEYFQNLNQGQRTLENYSQVYKLTEDQMAAAQKLVEAGVPAHQAAAYAKKLDADATAELNIETATEEAQETRVTKNIWENLVARLAEKAALIASAFGIKLKTKEGEKEVIVTNKETAALWAKNTALSTQLLLIGAVIAAIALLAAAIIGIIALFSREPDYVRRLKEAEEGLKTATAAADSANESFKTLKDSLDALSEKTNALDDLVVGTEEWKEALVEVNSQVLDLLDKYPELVATMDQHGVLRLDADSVSRTMASRRENVVRTNAAKLNATNIRNRAANNAALRNWYSNANVGSVAARIPTFDEMLLGKTLNFDDAITLGIRDEYASLAEALAKGEILTVKGMDEEDVKALKEVGEELLRTTQIEENSMRTMISNAMSLIDTNKYTATQLQQMSNIGIGQARGAIEKQTAKIMGLSDDDYEEMAKTYFEEFGTDVDVEKDGDITYKDENGQEQKLTKEQAVNQMAAANATNDLAKTLKLLPTAIGKVNRALGNTSFGNIYTQETGLGLSRSDLGNLKNIDLAQVWEENSELQEIYDSFEEFSKEIGKRQLAAIRAFKDNTKELTKLGLDEFDSKLSAEGEKGLIEHFAQIVAVSGSEEAKELQKNLNEMLSMATKVDREKIVSTLNSIDWHDADALEKLPETFRQLGVSISQAELETFVEDTKELAQAVHKIDLAKINEALVGLNNTLNNVRLNAQDRTVESGTYEALIAAAPQLAAMFQQDLNGNYVYLGKSMADLADALRQYTKELPEEAIKIAENKLALRNTLDALEASNLSLESGTIVTLGNWHQWDEADQKAYLKELVKANGDNDLYGINKWLSNTTDIDKLTTEALESIFGSLTGLETASALKQTLSTTAIQALATNMLSENASRNVHAAAAASGDTTGYAASRRALITQMQSAGLSETDLKVITAYNKELTDLEANEKTHTEQYKKYVELMNKAMNVGMTKTSYNTMYEGMKKNISAANELLEVYQKTTDERRQLELVTQMTEEFGLEVTEENYEKYMSYVNAMVAGNEQGLENLVNLSAYAHNLEIDSYEKLKDMDLNHILETYGQNAIDFITKMENAEYGWIETAEDGIQKWHWGTAALADAVKDLGKEIEKWYSPYDWLWNTEQKINALARERVRLEREWTLALEDNNKNVTQLSENLFKQTNNLIAQQDTQFKKFNNANEELKRTYDTVMNDSAFSPIQGAFGVTANGQVVVDKEALFNIDLSSDRGGVLESMIDKIVGLVDTAADAESGLYDIGDQLREIRKTGKDQYLSLIDRVTEALRNEYQAEIDKLNNINDAINTAQEKLVDKLQEKIDDDRQARDNAKKETELTNKATQLAYLQASGGSQLDILKAQKDLADSEQQYTDTLVDQSISAIQRANEQAATQRQEQIDLAQAQYDWWSEHDAIHEAEQLVDGSLLQIAEGLKPENTGLSRLLGGSYGDNIKAQSQVAIQEWYDSLSTDANLATIFQGNNGHGGIQGANEQIGLLATNLTGTAGALTVNNQYTNAIKKQFEALSVGEDYIKTYDSALDVDGEIGHHITQWKDQWFKDNGHGTEEDLNPGNVGYDSGTGGKTPQWDKINANPYEGALAGALMSADAWINGNLARRWAATNINYDQSHSSPTTVYMNFDQKFEGSTDEDLTERLTESIVEAMNLGGVVNIVRQ